MSRARNNRGFTLVELMVVISLLAIMAFIAVPNFTQLVRNNQVQAKAEELKTFLVMARTEAVNWRTTIDLDLAASDTWQAKRPSKNDQLLRKIELPQVPMKAVATDASGTTITELTYLPSGTASGAARFTVCYDEDAVNGFLITVQPNGSVRLHPRGKDVDASNNPITLASCE
ncbi:GspH/FimT family pseudopilin [Pseudomonas paralcaligenes]|uniref:GspH/FimT family pseudopilin n=1 Tax=Pseudomonas paralcaligenes TaxID=2772558 RepID=UPI001C824020|nr:GspH/FimT family pseudopilin [Pseudomonas paralcaligenes]